MTGGGATAEGAATRFLARGRNLPIAWAGVGLALLTAALVLVGFRHTFDWALPLERIPALPLAAGCLAAGIACMALLPLAATTARADDDLQRRLLWLVVIGGLVLRLLMLPTEPALEDDQQRYLWEGGLAAHGLSPYAIAPAEALTAPPHSPLGRLAVAAGPVLERVNHAHLKTIYPPVALAAFALAHWIEPFSLMAWRLVLLAAEGASLGLIVLLLRAAHRAPIWCALYWWNPIAIKEVMNSGHMEGVLLPLVLGAVLLAVRRRPLAATGVLGLAVGVKIWPLLLAPVLLRPWVDRPRLALAALALLGTMTALWAAPIVAGGLDARSGFVAYAERWQANGALLPAVRDSLGWVLSLLSLPTTWAGGLARGLLAGTAGLIALAAARRPIRDAADLCARVSLVTLALVLLSPAQFPWYMLWTLGFLPFAPRWSVMAMAMLVPLYYVSFHFSAIDAYHLFRDRVVWVIWLPIWGLLAIDTWRARRWPITRPDAPSTEH